MGDGLRGAARWAIGVAVVLSSVTGASAGSIMQPGETVGLAIGAPLPQGVYLIDTASQGNMRGVDDNDLFVNIPVLAWSTPWQLLGGRVEAYGAVPSVSFSGKVLDHTALYNTAAFVGVAWDLGGGWGFSNFVGTYFPAGETRLNQNFWTFNNRAGLSYTSDGWDLTVHAIYGATSTDDGVKLAPDFVNVDLTATKTFGKLEIGPIAYYSSDLTGSAKQSQFAVGGLVGWDFGPFKAQVYGSSDVHTENYARSEARAFGRLIVPLWNPPKETASLK
jgi:hypothetical protein